MRVIAALFGSYAPDALTSHVSVFPHNFKRFERLTKLATSSDKKLTAIQAALDGGASNAAICRTFGVKRTTLYDALVRAVEPTVLRGTGGA